MKQPLQIGITGGIGSGKSIVSKIFSILGVPVYDADSHAKELMTTDNILVAAIKKEFGDLSYTADGTLNRSFLAEHVFHDRKKLDMLNGLVHPRVGVNYTQWVERHASHPYVLKEAALLLEAKTNTRVDKVIVVTAPVDVRIARVAKRDAHRSVEQIKAIVEKQMPENEMLNYADYIVVNDETQLVVPQVLELHKLFIALAA